METENPKQAAILLSGGMDSTTLLWWMNAQRISEIHTIAIDYGQRHRVELECSRNLSEIAGARSHQVLALDLQQIGGSPLTDETLDVPASEDGHQVNTVVPYRNMLFVTLASAWAETQNVNTIYLSPVKDDYESYRDCRREFYDALEKSLRLGGTRETQLRIHTPFITKWKTEVIRMGLKLQVPYELTHTCYEGTRPACGICDACTERIEAFRANKTVDPLEYE